MKCEFFFVGKTSEKFLQLGVEEYIGRLRHYLPATVVIIPASAQVDARKALLEEGEIMLSQIKPRDLVIVLDENGSMLSSRELAQKMQKWMLEGFTKLIFVTGSAYGISEQLKKRANYLLSASRFTFTHQMIRLILSEQIYRAMTIIRNESYHHG